MLSNGLEVLFFVLVGANIILIVAAIISSKLRSRRAAAIAPVNPVRTTSYGSTVVSLATSSMARGYAATDKLDPPPQVDSADQVVDMLKVSEWKRLVDEEDVRQTRYGRTATIVMIEIDGFDRLIGAVGQQAADRVLTAVADTIRRHARDADQVGRLGPTRFGVLLPETDELAAINYVERVRVASDLWLESGAISLRLAIGWASPTAGSSLANAQVQALDRMFVEMHRRALRSPRAEVVPPTAMGGMEGATSPI